ncbi:MAG: hypothetical protein ACRD47_07690, partial [Nitrososphaeraceae archaeon]
MGLIHRLRYERTQIIAEGTLQLENINLLYSPIRIPFTKDERSIINTIWDKEITKKPSIFDGKLFHIKEQEFRLPHLIFNTSMSSFKEWIGTKNNKFKKLFGQNKTIKPLSVGSMIITDDNKWIIGRRVKTYDFENQY